ncbi:hypothetical protein [Frankia sp. Cppng1_Ct_nod]|uniref:hypothetical protein n=1 Tax=Frankia sp. Cppng1_Ct_nod TaxID=2897162 RepID=UPI0010410974|nr:hypothetical protein [Frankia sp. Cppng1_Ct_nod]
MSDEASEFGQLADALRALQATVSGVQFPAEVAKRARLDLEKLTGVLEPYAVPEAVQATGRIPGIPGRAQPLIPRGANGEADELRLVGQVTFGRYYRADSARPTAAPSH